MAVLLLAVRLAARSRTSQTEMQGGVHVPRTKMASKGRVTVPAEIRRHLDLRPGDELVFEIDGPAARVHAVRSRGLGQLRGALRATTLHAGRDAIREETGRRLGEGLAVTGATEDGAGT
jgi:AbrB family looped-hinge helix DNA binding protein